MFPTRGMGRLFHNWRISAITIQTRHCGKIGDAVYSEGVAHTDSQFAMDSSSRATVAPSGKQLLQAKYSQKPLLECRCPLSSAKLADSVAPSREIGAPD